MCCSIQFPDGWLLSFFDSLAGLLSTGGGDSEDAGGAFELELDGGTAGGVELGCDAGGAVELLVLEGELDVGSVVAPVPVAAGVDTGAVEDPLEELELAEPVGVELPAPMLVEPVLPEVELPVGLD